MYMKDSIRFYIIYSIITYEYINTISLKIIITYYVSTLFYFICNCINRTLEINSKIRKKGRSVKENDI